MYVCTGSVRNFVVETNKKQSDRKTNLPVNKLLFRRFVFSGRGNAMGLLINDVVSRGAKWRGAPKEDFFTSTQGVHIEETHWACSIPISAENGSFRKPAQF